MVRFDDLEWTSFIGMMEKSTMGMTSAMREVKDLAKRFEAQWLQQLNQA